MGVRRSLEDSLASFTGKPGHWAPPRDDDGRPWFPDHHAGIEREDDRADATFYRTGYRESDFSNLTLPRRFMGRSSFEGVSFVNTDLNQSFMCWNDFLECDFTDADLICCDMRASNFRNCKFVRCRLLGADLQGSSFEGCDFTDADLTGARVDDCTMDSIELSPEQSNQIGFWKVCGPQPKGG
jgi:hypothetical protein